jgi:hypothetical protein
MLGSLPGPEVFAIAACSCLQLLVGMLCRLVFSHVYPFPAAPDAAAYYTALEMSLNSKDKGALEFQKVLEGEQQCLFVY